MKPHGRDCPTKCSLCLGATPRIVTIAGPEVLVDGEPVRTSEDDSQQRYYAKRGGAAHGRKRQS